jgi:hypothetical protein
MTLIYPIINSAEITCWWSTRFGYYNVTVDFDPKIGFENITSNNVIISTTLHLKEVFQSWICNTI